MNLLSLLGLDVWLARWHAVSAEGRWAAQDRLELAHLEWREQKRHWRRLLALSLVMAIFMALALITLSLALIVHFWDTPQRVLVAWLLAGAWTLLWVGAMIALVSAARRGGDSFGLTRRELKQDWVDIKEHLP